MNHAFKYHMTPRRMWATALIGIGVMVTVALADALRGVTW